MRNKIAKNLLAMAVAVATLAGSAMPAMAADVELQGDDQTAKSQSIEVSTGYISSVYCVSVPAALNMEYRTITFKSENTNGYFCDLVIGAAGKILSSQKLVASLGINDDLSSPVLVGKTTGKEIPLSAVAENERWDWALNTFNGFNNNLNSLNWDSSNIGTCDYDGATISNYSFTERTVTIGFNENSLEAADEYAGTVTISFEIQ